MRVMSLLLLLSLAMFTEASLDKLLSLKTHAGHFGKFGDFGKTGGYYDPYLSATKSKIDHFLHESDSLGKRKLNVDVDYFNTPLEYLYLNQYHGFNHPLQGTELGYDMGLYNHINHFNTDGYSGHFVQNQFRPNVHNPYGLQQQYGPNVYGPAHAPNVYGPNVFGHQQQQYGPQQHQQQYGPQQQQHNPNVYNPQQQYGPNVHNPQQQQQQYGSNVYNPQQRVYEAQPQVYNQGQESQQVYDQGNTGNQVYESNAYIPLNQVYDSKNVYSTDSRPVFTNKESTTSFVTKDHGPQGYVPPSYEFISPVLGHVPSTTTNNDKFVNKEYTFGFADFAKAGSSSASASSFTKAKDNKDY